MKKMQNLPKACLHYVKPDYKFYACILAAFLIGGGLSAVFAFTLPELTCKELLLYLNDFFKNMNQNGADSAALFKTSLLLNLQNFALLFLFSVMVIGAPFIAAFAAVRGFIHCFTLLFMFRLYGIRAALFFIAGMLPHYLLLIPGYLMLYVICLKFSVSLIREKHDLKNKLPRFLLTLVCLFVVTMMAALLQSYVEPVLIRLISGLYIGS